MPRDMEDKVKDMLARGWSDGDIARRLGLSVMVVQAIHQRS